jgi:hypothetical protein
MQSTTRNFYSRSHDVVICVYDKASNVIETTRPRFGQKSTESRPQLEAARRTATQSSRNLYDSSHDAARAPLYRMLNYERNHNQAKGAQMHARHVGQRDRQWPIQAIIGSEVIPPVKPELLPERKEVGICNRSAAFRHHRHDFCLARLRGRGCAEPVSAAHRKLSVSIPI